MFEQGECLNKKKREQVPITKNNTLKPFRFERIKNLRESETMYQLDTMK